jgi:4-hydroxy-tetrahydrodipicolinate synthase
LKFVETVCNTTRFPVFSGDDDQTLSVMQKGGVGSISVIGNAVPSDWRQMIHAALSKDWQRAEELFTRYLPLCKANFIETNPQCIKYVVSQMGKCKPVYRLPLVLPTEETQGTIKQVLVKLALPFYQTTTRQVG